MRREDALARSEHERFMAENGLDLLSVLRRAVAERLGSLRRAAAARPAPAVRPALAPVALSLVASVKRQPHEDRAA